MKLNLDFQPLSANNVLFCSKSRSESNPLITMTQFLNHRVSFHAGSELSNKGSISTQLVKSLSGFPLFACFVVIDIILASRLHRHSYVNSSHKSHLLGGLMTKQVHRHPKKYQTASIDSECS